MLEEQAISRLHRLGETKPVFIRRFVIRNTFEQKIVERQVRKRVLADLVLGRKTLKEGDDGKRQLMVGNPTPYSEAPRLTWIELALARTGVLDLEALMICHYSITT